MCFIFIFKIGAVKDGMKENEEEIWLEDYVIPSSLEFELFISCDDSNLIVNFNGKWTAELPYNASNLKDVSEVQIVGSLNILKGGLSGMVSDI